MPQENEKLLLLSFPRQRHWRMSFHLLLLHHLEGAYLMRVTFRKVGYPRKEDNLN